MAMILGGSRTGRGRGDAGRAQGGFNRQRPGTEFLLLEFPSERRILNPMRDSGSKLVPHRPKIESVRASAQVLQFRPRERLGDRSGPGNPASQATPGVWPEGELLDDLAQYEQDNEDESVNAPRRMLMNIVALAVVAVLIGVGVWLADSIGRMERNQDCVLQGRQNCLPIEVSAPRQTLPIQN